jgi:hypothetical protein
MCPWKKVLHTLYVPSGVPVLEAWSYMGHCHASRLHLSLEKDSPDPRYETVWAGGEVRAEESRSRTIPDVSVGGSTRGWA